MFGKVDEFWNHEIQGSIPSKHDVELSRIVITSLLEDTDCSLKFIITPYVGISIPRMKSLCVPIGHPTMVHRGTEGGAEGLPASWQAPIHQAWTPQLDQRHYGP